MTKPLRTTGIVFLTMLLVLLSLMVPVHAEDQKAAGAGTTGADKKSIYDNDYDMGSLKIKDFNTMLLQMESPDDSIIIDKNTIVRGSGNGFYILKFSTPEEAYKAYGYYKSRNDSVEINHTGFALISMPQFVSFDANGGKGAMAEQTIIFWTEGAETFGGGELSKNLFSREGYTFSGWNTKANGSGTAYSDGQKVVRIKDLVKVSDAKYMVTLYAQWTPDKYTVRYHANGGTGQMTDQEMAYGTEKPLIAKGFTRDGYEFTGWNTKADGSGRMYKDKENVKNLTSENNGKVELYAQWEKNNSKAISDSASGFTGPKTGDNNGIGRNILILAAACTLVIVLRAKKAKGISE